MPGDGEAQCYFNSEFSFGLHHHTCNIHDNIYALTHLLCCYVRLLAPGSDSRLPPVPSVVMLGGTAGKINITSDFSAEGGSIARRGVLDLTSYPRQVKPWRIYD